MPGASAAGLPGAVMRLGVMLPSFRNSAEPALAMARAAEVAGVDGVFIFDHLWPMGRPDRPAISAFPLLGAVAAATRRVHVGPLVARIGLVGDDVLLTELLTLRALVGDRLIAALGTGDHKSAEENVAYGVAYGPAAVRRASLEAVADALVAAGVPTWVGGGSAKTMDVARRSGATVNLWDATPAWVATEALHGPVSWGGVLPAGRAAAASLLGELAAAGASWAVTVWTGSLDDLVAAAAGEGIGPAGADEASRG